MRQSLAGFPDDPVAERDDQSGLFCQGDEVERGHHAAGGVMPSYQGLEADERLRCGIDERLVKQAELPGLDTFAHVMFHALLVLDPALHLGAEITAGASALRLGLI